MLLPCTAISLLKREIEGTCEEPHGVATTGSRRASTKKKKKTPDDETIHPVCGSHNLLRKVKHRFRYSMCASSSPQPSSAHTRACVAFQFDSCAPAVILPSRPTLPTLRSNYGGSQSSSTKRSARKAFLTLSAFSLSLCLLFSSRQQCFPGLERAGGRAENGTQNKHNEGTMETNRN